MAAHHWLLVFAAVSVILLGSLARKPVVLSITIAVSVAYPFIRLFVDDPS